MGTMGSAVTFLLLLSGLALVVFARARAQNKWTALLKDLATEWGLEVVEGPHDHVIGSGRRGPLEVKLWIDEVGIGRRPDYFTRVEIQTPLRGELTLGSEGVLELLGKAFRGKDIETGLTRFDDRVAIRGGGDAEALAFLDAATRVAVLGAVDDHGATLDDEGLLSWRWRGVLTDRAVIEPVLRDLVRLGERLAQAGDDRETRLAEHVASDPEAAFRAQCLHALARAHPGSPATEQALAAAATDDAPEVRLAAALQSGDVDGLLDASALSELAGARRVATRTRAARAVAAMGEPDEPLLLLLLADEAVEVKVAAAEALGEVGSLAAVEQLNSAADGVTTDRALKKAARSAVGAIQDRVGGVGGSLSLSGEDAAVGAVSLAVELD